MWEGILSSLKSTSPFSSSEPMGIKEIAQKTGYSIAPISLTMDVRGVRAMLNVLDTAEEKMSNIRSKEAQTHVNNIKKFHRVYSHMDIYYPHFKR